MKLTCETNGGVRFELDVNSNDTLQEIKRKIQAIYGFDVSSQTLFFNTNKITTDYDLLAAAHIDGSPSTSSRKQGRPGPNQLHASASTQPPPKKFSITLKYGRKTMLIPIMYGAEVKASLMRAFIDMCPHLFRDLPDPYFFMCNQKPIDENHSFLSQNIVDGDVIEIFPGSVARSMSLTLETNRRNQMAFIQVETHSNDTILQLKEKIARNYEGIQVHKILITKNRIEQPNHNTLQACSIMSKFGIKVEFLE